MKVWKIASRWSNDGNSNSVLHLFKEHKIAFVENKKNIRVDEVKIGDLFAISDGFKIVGIGKVLTEVKAITDFYVQSLNQYNEEECTVGFGIEPLYLSEAEVIHYEHIGRFHELHDKERKKVIKLWEQNIINLALANR